MHEELSLSLSLSLVLPSRLVVFFGGELLKILIKSHKSNKMLISSYHHKHIQFQIQMKIKTNANFTKHLQINVL